MLQRLKQAAHNLALTFGERRMSFNSRRAQEAAKWAETHGKADAFHHAAFRAYFVNGKNLYDIETLAAAADSVGLMGGALAEVIRQQTYQAAVDQDWLRPRQLGITAVPTFRLNDKTLVGAQPYETLADLLIRGR